MFCQRFAGKHLKKSTSFSAAMSNSSSQLSSSPASVRPATMRALFVSCLAAAGSVSQAQTMTVMPSNLAFANTVVGVRSAKQTLTVTNTGATAVQLGATDVVIRVSGSDYFERDVPGTGSTTCTRGGVLNQGQSCTIGVSFAPQVAAAWQASWRLDLATANITVTPVNITLTGTGMTAPVPPPTSNQKVDNSGGGVGATDHFSVLALIAALFAGAGLRRRANKRA
jgi:hypothetical protein